MNTSTVTVYVSGHEQNIFKATGLQEDPFVTNCQATFELSGSTCTIYDIKPTSSHVGLHLPLPFSFPVRDQGTGVLTEIHFDADEMKAAGACPRGLTATHRTIKIRELAKEWGI